jgi:hypothetical protein
MKNATPSKDGELRFTIGLGTARVGRKDIIDALVVYMDREEGAHIPTSRAHCFRITAKARAHHGDYMWVEAEEAGEEVWKTVVAQVDKLFPELKKGTQ